MAKSSKRSRGSQVRSRDGHGLRFEHNEEYDDSLLPDASELERPKGIDPDIMSWLKERTAKEQDARHDFADRRMGLLERGQNKSFTIDLCALIAAFLILE